MFFINPINKINKINSTILQRIVYSAKHSIIKVGAYLGFTNIQYTYVHGKKERVHLGNNCSTVNSIFNVISGEIHIGDNTIFGHNCMVLTGTHNFKNGIRASLYNSELIETPDHGRDILIGKGCWIGSGAIIIGPLTIGDNVIIGAGSVVTKSLPDSCFAAGVPAKIIKKH